MNLRLHKNVCGLCHWAKWEYLCHNARHFHSFFFMHSSKKSNSIWFIFLTQVHIGHWDDWLHWHWIFSSFFCFAPCRLNLILTQTLRSHPRYLAVIYFTAILRNLWVFLSLQVGGYCKSHSNVQLNLSL